MSNAQFDAWANSEIDLDAGFGEPDDYAEFMAYAAEQDREHQANPLDDPAFVDFLDAQELLPRAA